METSQHCESREPRVALFPSDRFVIRSPLLALMPFPEGVGSDLEEIESLTCITTSDVLTPDERAHGLEKLVNSLIAHRTRIEAQQFFDDLYRVFEVLPWSVSFANAVLLARLKLVRLQLDRERMDLDGGVAYVPVIAGPHGSYPVGDAADALVHDYLLRAYDLLSDMFDFEIRSLPVSKVEEALTLLLLFAQYGSDDASERRPMNRDNFLTGSGKRLMQAFFSWVDLDSIHDQERFESHFGALAVSGTSERTPYQGRLGCAEAGA